MLQDTIEYPHEIVTSTMLSIFILSFQSSCTTRPETYTFYYNTHVARRVTAYIIQVDPTATVGSSVPHKGLSEERARVRFYEFFETRTVFEFFFEFFFVSDTRYHSRTEHRQEQTEEQFKKKNFNHEYVDPIPRNICWGRLTVVVITEKTTEVH